MHEELGRDHVELFGYRFADDRQRMAAAPAGATFQRVAVLDPGQMGGEELTPGTAARGLARQGHLGERLAGFRGGEVGLQVLLEQSQLAWIEPFGRGPEPPALKTGQFELEGLDQEGIFLHLGGQCQRHLTQVVVVVRKGIGKAYHGRYFTTGNLCRPRQIRLGRISVGVWTRRQSCP